MRATVLALLFQGALGNECAAGYKHKKDLTGLQCIGATTTAAGCNSQCCELDKNTCGGLDATKAIACPWGTYKANTDAWKKTPATEKTQVEKCCATKPLCENSGFACPAGQKKKASELGRCPGGFDTCLGSVCCEPDTKTCQGTNPAGTCDSGKAKWNAQSKAGTPLTNGWKKTATDGTEADFKAKCCTAAATCDKATCPAGNKKIGTPAGTKCTDKDGNPSADEADCSRKTTPCCEANPLTCGGAKAGKVLKCSVGTKTESGSGSSWDAITVAAAGDQAKYESACCKTKPTCAQATCAAGTKMKKEVAKTSCTSDLASCQDDCCESDDQKCGGVTGIACPYGFFNEADTWNSKTPAATKDEWKNKAGNETNKNTNCCTARMECFYGTTTPVPVVVTTTPAAALKYSVHKAAIQEGTQPQGGNVAYLGAGAVLGMGVLMVVQRLRSGSQGAQE